ncbi:glutamate--tRNA ligase [Candidatus Peribacteria bacterium]|jgi:glutamyl-tRNA synthetase|nr:glutamate--tRNA ligase [Candidatus Peribacteria bacterium]MBT4021419.1 glutamate--tRNA ligase [Candidatus Peribacteria bacterium]MBT4240435.1 glutamate--tRNA ligase [Candidatus Peribacteria bacterium]MBT4474517.1 glutamate--tRNA ligase [Candidatus Peribacteria bacterium]
MRTRFAPSPTGYLHIGGLRTALFSYLMAKKEKGTFYLRIEDTDRERHIEEAIDHLKEMMDWAGFKIDDGPYIQSERLEIYKEHAQKLMDSGKAYRCFCSKDRLDEMRKDQEKRKQAPMYDRTCVNLSKEESEERAKSEPHVIRFLVPRGETVEFNDHIRGNVKFKTNTIDDQVLLKSDGFPTYHLAHIVDDHLMETTLVIRGEEWLPSLPKHILLFRAFGWEPVEYAHVPLLLSKGGGKLSKRDGDVSVEKYIEKGYLREVIINFIAMLGWNPGTEEEVFSMEELIEKFSLERVQKGGAIFDTAKLDWLQGQWMRKMPIEEFCNQIQPLVVEKYPDANKDSDFFSKATLIQERITFFSEAQDMMGYFYETPKVEKSLLASDKQKVKEEDLPKIFEILISELESMENWTEEDIKTKLFEAAKANELKNGQLLWPMRAALTGLPYSPGAFEVATVLGKDETLNRLKSVIG